MFAKISSLSEQTLLITGANGFLGLHVIREALDRGYHVRGTVRSEASAAKVRDLFIKNKSKLSLRQVPDFTKRESYESAFSETTKPITGVINVAAPFTLKVEDTTKDLLDPALKSAVAVLEATKLFGPNVLRVVNTSSFAAILDLSQGYRPGYTYTEEDWNPTTYEEAAQADPTAAYAASKGLAEKYIWDWIKSEQPAFSLVSINPTWIFGPHIGKIADLQRLNASTEALWRLLDAKDVPPTDFAGFTDVRVAAAAHLEAFARPEAGGQRFLLSSHFDYQTAIDSLRESIPQLKSRLPEGTPGAGKLEKVYVVNGEKAENVLGIKYISLDKTMKDSVLQLLEAEKTTA